MSWNEARMIVEAYSRLRDDNSLLANSWIVDEDVVELLHIRYNFEEAGITLDHSTLNRAVGFFGYLAVGWFIF